MRTRQHLVLASASAAILLVAHLDFWRPQRALLLLGWIPEELAWRLGWMLLAGIWIHYACATIWRAEDGPAAEIDGAEEGDA